MTGSGPRSTIELVVDMRSGGGPTQPDDTWVGTLAEAARPVDEESALGPGQLVGRYVVVEHLGAGGMGVVVAAYDPELDRKIALKLLHAHRRGGEHGRMRMVREAQALARLSHPNVVAVHDVGTHEGQVFLAMEYVDGQVLTEWMRGTRSWREIRDVFLAAARGLQAAHAVGLVHRDFKPDNVMVSPDGRVRVMDFGLARTDGETEPGTEEPGAPVPGSDVLATPLTRTGALMGTPAYMSPEQHAGLPADARSDQFSFCVTMWEALYGHRPFRGATPASLGLAVSEGKIEEPPAGRGVPPWLRKAVARGLRPDPAARWPSMEALSDALQRDPRRRGLWLGAGAMAAAAAAGLFAVQMEAAPCEDAPAPMGETWSADRRARVQAALAGVDLEFAGETARRVVERLDGHAAAWAAGATAACEATKLRGTESPAELAIRTACLNRRRQAMDELVTVFLDADRPVVTSAVAAVMDLPDVATCADLDALRREVELPTDPRTRAAIAEVRLERVRGAAMLDAGRTTPALVVVEEALARARELGFLPVVAELLLDMGTTEIDLGRFDDAEAHLREAYRLALPAGHDVVAVRASSLLTYVVGYRLARAAEGEIWGESATALASRLEPGGLEEAFALHNVGVLLDASGRAGDALGPYGRALEIRRARLGERHPDVARSLNNLGNVYLGQGSYDRAAEHYQRSLEIREELFGSNHPEVTGSLNNLSLVLRRRGELDEAARLQRRAIVIVESVSGSESADLAQYLNNLASLERLRGKLEVALELDERALAIREARLGPEHPDVADPVSGLAMTHEARGDLERARELHQRALTLVEGAFADAHPAVVSARVSLARVLLQLKSPEAARVLLERAVGPAADTSGAEPVVVAEGLALWARVLARAAGRSADADAAALRARDLYRAAGAGFEKEAASVEQWLTDRAASTAP